MLFVTGNSNASSREQAGKTASEGRAPSSPWAYLTKPLKPATLVQTLGTLLLDTERAPSPHRDHDSEPPLSTFSSGEFGGGGGGGSAGGGSDASGGFTPLTCPSDVATTPLTTTALSPRWQSPDARAAENIRTPLLPRLRAAVRAAGYQLGLLTREGTWFGAPLVGEHEAFADSLQTSSSASLRQALRAFQDSTEEAAQLSLACKRLLPGAHWLDVMLLPVDPDHPLVMARRMTLEEAAGMSAVVDQDGQHATDAQRVHKELQHTSQQMQQLLKVSGHVFRNVLMALASVLGDPELDPGTKQTRCTQLVAKLRNLLAEVQTATILFTAHTASEDCFGEAPNALEPLQLLVDELSEHHHVTTVPAELPSEVKGPLPWLRRLVHHLVRWGTSSEPAPSALLRLLVPPSDPTMVSVSLDLRYPSESACEAASTHCSTRFSTPTCHEGRLPSTAGMLGAIVKMLAHQRGWQLHRREKGCTHTLTLRGCLQPTPPVLSRAPRPPSAASTHSLTGDPRQGTDKTPPGSGGSGVCSVQ